MRSRKKGFAAERELARKFWRKGFAVVRGPASGSKTKHLVYPDIVAMYKGKIIVIEVKTRSKPAAIYVDKDKVERLKEFAKRAGGEVYFAVKFQGEEWRFIPLHSIVKNGNKYKIPLEVIRVSDTLDKLIAKMTNLSLDEALRKQAQCKCGESAG